MKKLCSLLILLAIILSLFGCSARDDGAILGAVPDAAGEALDSNGNGNPFNDIQAGMLTAGEWKDANDLPFWQELLAREEWSSFMELRHLHPDKIVQVQVTDADENPCFMVPVQLTDDHGNVLFEAMTDISGQACLLYDLQNTSQQAAFVCVNGVQYPVSHEPVKIVAQDTGLAVTQLDLMLMVDTTGSMSDELRYLQTELKDVIARVANAGEALSIHVSVNFYRDVGDEYVLRDFPFTADISQVIADLKAQDASGGGDYPEAVHVALDNAILEHQWRDDAVKLCFFVLDAPPHKEHEIQGIDAQLQNTVLEAARRGIRIIPIASSGVDKETEFLLRSWALMTGGTYTFLTNHSGIGNDHMEPTVGQYTVEPLNSCLIRIISQYCGLAQQ